MQPPMISGRTLVLATLGVAVAMAFGGWWYRYDQSRRTAQFWGGEASQTIVDADKVELIKLARAAEEETADGAALAPGYRVLRTDDLSQAKGLVYLGYALTRDANFDWDAPPVEPADVTWGEAIRFTKGKRSAVVLLSSDRAKLAKGGAERVVPPVLSCPQMAGPLETFFATAIEEKEAAAEGERVDQGPASTLAE